MMYIKYLALLIFCSTGASCQQSASRRAEKELKKHLQPQDSVINQLRLGKTFVLESSERQGIDLGRFKEFDYWKELDATYFEHITDKTFSDPDVSGGIATTLAIYKAIKKGDTEIRFYRRKFYGNKPNNDTATKITDELYNTYRFHIE